MEAAILKYRSDIMLIKEAYLAESLEEALRILGEVKEKPKLIAGGTDLIIDLRNGKVTPNSIIDISNIRELKGVDMGGDKVVIKALSSFTDLVEMEALRDYRGLVKACRMVGSPQIRNKGTLGGNIANGSPAADSVVPLIALGASLEILSPWSRREVLLEDYYLDPIKDDEIITKIVFKKLGDNDYISFSKLGLRKALAISRMSIACFTSLEAGLIKEVRIASGALGKYPMREKELEEFLLGRDINQEGLIEEAVEVIQKSMDQRLQGRSSLSYKRLAIESILKEALEDIKTYSREGAYD